MYEVARFLDKMGCRLTTFDRTDHEVIWNEETGEPRTITRTVGTFEHAKVEYGFFADMDLRPTVEVYTVASPYRRIRDLCAKTQFQEFIKKKHGTEN